MCLPTESAVHKLREAELEQKQPTIGRNTVKGSRALVISRVSLFPLSSWASLASIHASSMVLPSAASMSILFIKLIATSCPSHCYKHFAPEITSSPRTMASPGNFSHFLEAKVSEAGFRLVELVRCVRYDGSGLAVHERSFRLRLAFGVSQES